MTTDQILVKYTADLTAFEKQLNDNSKKLKDLENQGKKSFKGIEGAAADAGNKLSSTFANIGAGIVAAFSIQAIKAFAGASIDAFAKAEAQTNQLRFAVEKVGKMGDAVFKALIKQSKELAAITFFDDEDIQDAQRLLVQIGLNADEIEKLTPLVLDLAAAQGTDLATAAQKAVAAINGQTRGLKDVGANFENTGTKVGNYNALVERLGKIQGAATDALNTTFGAMKKMDVDVENLQESIGEKLAPAFVKAKKAFFGFIDAILTNPFDVFKDETPLEFFERIKKQTSESAFLSKLSTEQIQKNIEELQASESKASGESRTRALASIAGLKEILRLRKELKATGENADGLTGQDAAEKAKQDAEKEEKAKTKAFEDATKEREKLQQIYTTKIDTSTKDLTDKTILSEMEEQAAIKAMENAGLENTLRVNELKLQSEEESREKIKQAAEQFTFDALNTIQELENIAFDNKRTQLEERQSAVETAMDAEAAALEKRNERGAISDREYARQKDILDAKRKVSEEAFNKQQRKIAHDQAVNNKIFAIFNIILLGAQSIMKASAAAPPPFNIPLIALAAATTGLQLAIAASAPISALAKGTSYVERGRNRKGIDTIPAWLNEGERIVSAEKNKKNWEALEALDNNKFHEFVHRKYVLPVIIEYQKKIAGERSKEHARNIGAAVFSNMSGMTNDEMKKLWKSGIIIKNMPQQNDEQFIYNKYGSWQH